MKSSQIPILHVSKYVSLKKFCREDESKKPTFPLLLFSADSTIGMVRGLTALRHYGNKV